MNEVDGVIKAICDNIIQVVKESPEGVPGGLIYTALMTIGIDFDQYNGFMNGLVKAKQLVKRGDLYFIGEQQ